MSHHPVLPSYRRHKQSGQAICAALPYDLIDSRGTATNTPRLKGKDTQPGEVNVDARLCKMATWQATYWVQTRLPPSSGSGNSWRGSTHCAPSFRAMTTP